MFALAGYNILEEIYHNTKTAIYRAIFERDKTSVIIKILNSDYPTPQELTKLRYEYELTQKIKSAGVMKSYRLESYSNSLALILEDFGGKSLREVITQHSLDLLTVLQLAIQLAETLGELHKQQIIHKDVKPDNIIFNSNTGQVKFTDFSISSMGVNGGQVISSPHTLEGTLAYMSPEQTGRMNRKVDYRSDLYSLGVTLYELLVGQLPFESNDPLELIHCHLAKLPAPPHSLNSEIPTQLSCIILKLMEKNAENRYQSATGLRADLQICLHQLQTTSTVEKFVCGQYDIADKFQVPQKLYGREKEIQTLLATFDQVCQGKPEMLFISGYAGLGKTSLVQEVYKPITAKRGYFIMGKFDQFQRNIPYSAILKAFQELVKQLLIETETNLARWREKLLANLGINAQVIIDVIPEVELILGKQPPVPELPPAQARNRFHLVFQNFIKIFTRPEHPLVLFLDDLQWADSASLNLLQMLVTTRDNHYLFIIGAYRDNEVNSAHPLWMMIEEIQQTGVLIQHLYLSHWEITTLNQLLRDMFNTSPLETQPLAELVFLKTQGNPFSVNEFLKALHAEGLLYFELPSVKDLTTPLVTSFNNSTPGSLRDPRSVTAGWRWDLAKIQAREITDNVVELLMEKIQRLRPETQQVLQLAACVGSSFKIETLKLVCEKNLSDTLTSLQEAVTEGLILPLTQNNFQFAVFCSTILKTIENYQMNDEYKFAHDRIRQAAYSLMTTTQRQFCHSRIGQILLHSTPADKQEEVLFNIVNQLNLGRELIEVRLKKDELAQLNLRAGQKAKAAAAYETALRYFSLGLELLGEKGWQRLYSLCLSLTVEAAEVAYLMGEFGDMENFVETVLQEGHSLLDKIKVYEIRMQAYKAQNQPQLAVELGLWCLRQLRVKFPKQPTVLDTTLSSLRTKWALRGKSIASLVNLPSMKAPQKLAAMRIMLSISPAVYAIRPQLLPLITLTRIQLSLKYGNAYESAPAYASYGYLLCAKGEIDAGFKFGQLALQLLEQNQMKELKARIFQIVHGVITHSKQAVRSTLKPLQDAYQSGLETGNFEYAALSATTYATHAYWVGRELTVVEREIAIYTESIVQLKQEASLPVNHLYWQAILNLRGYSETPSRLQGEAYQETEMLPQHQKAQARGLIFQVYTQKLMLSYLFGNSQEAFNNALQASQYVDAVIGSLLVAVFYFYDSLARLAQFEKVPNFEREQILKRVTNNQKRMKEWASHAPMNYLHKFYLVEAERARVLHQDGDAREWYDRAITLAQQHEYLNEEALAAELAAKFYLTKKCGKIAQIYLREAHYAYSRWGALAKVKQLEREYSKLLSPSSEFPNLPLSSETGLQSCQMSSYGVSGARSSAFTSLHQEAGTSITSTIQGDLRDFDLTTVFKASQAFVGEIMLKRLLEKLMKLVIENAGAQTGFLLLEENGQWMIQARANVNHETVEISQLTFVEDSPEVSAGIIHYVVRTKEYVVLSDATQTPKFANDLYVQLCKPKSVLCAPLVNQGKTIAILYLENNLISGAFTPQRLELLYLLSSQMAIAIENAKLYADLEEKVKERTLDLAAKNSKLIVLNEKLIRANQEKNEFLGIAAHDLKNPLAAIQGLAEMIERDFDELSKPEILELAKMISISSQQMFELIKNLLDVNRLESGKLDLSLSVFDILPVVEWVVNSYKERARTKNITLHFDAASSEYLAFGDEKTIRQVLDNLISNAVKYSPQGKSVYVRMIQTKRHLRCQIQDEGPGLSLEDKQKLFGKFTRLTPQPTGNENSTGLGLFIVKKLVEAMQGKVWCESELGKGAVFTVELRKNVPVSKSENLDSSI